MGRPRKNKTNNTEINEMKVVDTNLPSLDELIEKAEEKPKYPDLFEWVPEDNNIFFIFDEPTGKVVARFEEFYNITRDTQISKFKINQGHYKKRMPEICQHMNYFINFYDTNNELYNSIFSVKFTIDKRPSIQPKAFRELVLNRIITPSLVEKIKQMAKDLYVENIADNNEEKYVATPKITNSQAKQVLAISFCIRIILPLCLHYTNINEHFEKKTAYIPFLNKLIMKIIAKFEKDDIKVFNTLCRFVEYRVDKYYGQHYLMWAKKKQLYGIEKCIYLDEVIHEVIVVKGLYKIDYRRSVVSFIDGVIFKHHVNFKRENFKTKPVEIDQYDSATDNDNYLSHAEALEMQAYKVDASSAIFTDANINQVLKRIRENFRFTIPEEEIQFYYDNLMISNVTESFIHDFYSRIFHDTNADIQLTKRDTVILIVILKKYLQCKGMTLLAQLCTAKIRGKFKENLIKNAKFLETVNTSDVHQNIIAEKFKYVDELFPGENLNMRKVSAFINSELELVDYNSPDNGKLLTNINIQQLVDEYDTFLSII